MLTQIEGEALHWRCLLYDEYGDLVSCGKAKIAHIDETVSITRNPDSARGPTIALPRCGCGAQTFLKADYSLKELFKGTLTIRNADGEIWAYALKPIHARNLRAHWMLYARGGAAFAPMLPAPPPIVPDGLPCDFDTFASLWFGFGAVNSYRVAIGAPPLAAHLTSTAITRLLASEKEKTS